MSVTEIPELDRARGRCRGDPTGGPPARPARDGRRARSPRPGPGLTLGELVAHVAARSGRFAAYLSGAAVPRGRSPASTRRTGGMSVIDVNAPRRPGRGAPVERLELRRHDPRQARRGPVAVVLGGHAGRRDRLRFAARRADRARLRRGDHPRTPLADRGQRRPNGGPRHGDARAPVRRPGRDARRPHDVSGRGPGGPRSGFGSTTERPRSNPPKATRTARSAPSPRRWSCCRTGASRDGEGSRGAGSSRRGAAPAGAAVRTVVPPP